MLRRSLCGSILALTLGASALLAQGSICPPPSGSGGGYYPAPTPPPGPIFTPTPVNTPPSTGGVTPLPPTAGGTTGGAGGGPTAGTPTAPQPGNPTGPGVTAPKPGGTTGAPQNGPGGRGTTTGSGQTGAGAAGGVATPGGTGRPGGSTGGGTAGGRPAGGGRPGPVGSGTRPGSTPAGAPGGATPAGRKVGRSFETSVTWEYWWGQNSAELLESRHGRAAVTTTATAAPADAAHLADRTRMAIVPFLKAGMLDADQAVRAAAAIALGKCGDANAEALLIAALDDKAAEVRENACIGLGLLATPGARAALLAVVKDDAEAAKLTGKSQRMTTTLRAHAALGLAFAANRTQIEPRECEALAAIACDHHADAEIGVAMAYALGIMRSPAAVPALSALTADGESDLLRAAAATALGKIGDRASIPALVARLDDKSVHVRRSAIIALGGTASAGDGAVVLALTKVTNNDEDVASRRFAMTSLGRIGGPKATEAIARLLDIGEAADRAFAALAIGYALHGEAPDLRTQMGERIVRGLIEASSCETKGAYAIGCALLDYTPAAAEIRKILVSPAHEHLRVECAQALGILRDHASIDDLARIARTTDEPVLRFATLEALGMMGDPSVVSLVNGLIDEIGGNAVTGGATLRGLGLVGDGKSVVRFGQVLRNSIPSTDLVRAYAATALGLLGDKDDVSALRLLGRAENYVSQNGLISDLLAKAIF